MERNRKKINVLNYADSLKLFSLLCENSLEEKVALKILKHSNITGYNSHLNNLMMQKYNAIIKEKPDMCEFINLDRSDMIENILSVLKLDAGGQVALSTMPIEIINSMNSKVMDIQLKKFINSYKVPESEILTKQEKVFSLMELDKKVNPNELDKENKKKYDFLINQNAELLDDFLDTKFSVFTKSTGIELAFNQQLDINKEKDKDKNLFIKDVVTEMAKLAKMSKYYPDKEDMELLNEVTTLECSDAIENLQEPLMVVINGSNYPIDSVTNSFELLQLDQKLYTLGADDEYVKAFKQYTKAYNISHAKLAYILNGITASFSDVIYHELAKKDDDLLSREIYDPKYLSVTLSDKIYNQMQQNYLTFAQIKLLHDNFDLFTKQSDFLYSLFNEVSYIDTFSMINIIINTKLFYNDIFNSDDLDIETVRYTSQAGMLCKKYFMTNREIVDANVNHPYYYKQFFKKSFDKMRNFIDMVKM